MTSQQQQQLHQQHLQLLSLQAQLTKAKEEARLYKVLGHGCPRRVSAVPLGQADEGARCGRGSSRQARDAAEASVEAVSHAALGASIRRALSACSTALV